MWQWAIKDTKKKKTARDIKAYKQNLNVRGTIIKKWYSVDTKRMERPHEERTMEILFHRAHWWKKRRWKWGSTYEGITHPLFPMIWLSLSSNGRGNRLVPDHFYTRPSESGESVPFLINARFPRATNDTASRLPPCSKPVVVEPRWKERFQTVSRQTRDKGKRTKPRVKKEKNMKNIYKKKKRKKREGKKWKK